MATRKVEKSDSKVAAKKAPEKVATKSATKVATKPAVKSATKVAAKTATKKPAKKETESRTPKSKFICNLISERKWTDEQIAKKLGENYSDLKHCDTSAVKYYRNYMNLGKMVSSGFEKPKTPYVAIEK